MTLNNRTIYDSEGRVICRPLVPLGRAPASERRIRTSASVRDVLLTLGRAIGVSPEELDAMSADEYTRRRAAVRAGR
jgi:hypothetical protein